MKKLIIIEERDLVVCDNPTCDFKIPSTSDINIVDCINKPCPECGENLLTEKDYLQYVNVMKVVDWLNKWFSWLTIFERKNQRKKATLHVHNGLNITK